jgi:hypothetical protein
MELNTAMNLRRECDEENSDRVDVGAIARAGMLMGSYLALAGFLGQHPVLSTMAEVYAMDPFLTPEETLVFGLVLMVGSAGGHYWNMFTTPHRRLRS